MPSSLLSLSYGSSQDNAGKNRENGVLHNNKQSLGGWLILVGTAILLAPLKIAYDTFITYSNLFFRDEWVLVSHLGNNAHVSRIEQLMFGQILVGILFVLAWIFVAGLFFCRKRHFPKWFIGLWVATLITAVLDMLLTKAMLPDTPVLDFQHFSEQAYLGLSALIWIPYMLRSQRVKATFVA